MAKLIKYDVSGVEESGGGTGVKVKPGLRIAKIVRCQQREAKRDGSPANDIEVALDFGSEYDWGFTYIGLSEAADWKLAEFVRAVGLKDRGQFDPDKMLDKFVRVKVNSGQYEGEYSPQMGKLMKAVSGDDETWAEGNGSVSELSGSSKSGPEDDDDNGDDDDDAAVDTKTYSKAGFEPSREGEEFGSYDDWTDDDLYAEAEDRDLTLPGGRGSKRNKTIAALRAEDNAVSDAADEAETTEDDYDEWDLDQLKEEWDQRQLGKLPAIRGRGAEESMMAAIIEQLRADDSENPFDA